MYSPLSTGGLCCCPHGRLLNPATASLPCLAVQLDPAFVFAPFLVPDDEDAEHCERKRWRQSDERRGHYEVCFHPLVFTPNLVFMRQTVIC